jgi:hypothetical protein
MCGDYLPGLLLSQGHWLLGVGRGEGEDGQGILTVILLPQVTGDQEWEEGREKMGRES